MGLAVDVENALRLGGHEQRYAYREGDILCVGRSELVRRGPLDDQRLAALERLPRDGRADGDTRSDQATRPRRADDEGVARGIDRHERGGLVGHRLVSGLKDQIEELVGTRGVPDAHCRALERAEQRGGGQVAVDDSTRPLRTA